MYGPEAWKKLSAAEQKNALPIQPGDVKWRDINGDGMIDNYDQVVVGNTNPHWIGGFNTTLRWKNFQLYGRFDFAFDYWIYDNTTLGSWVVCKELTIRPKMYSTLGLKRIRMPNIRDLCMLTSL